MADYIRYRPGYPSEVVDLLCGESGLQQGACVVDVGSGTGILSEMFLDRGMEVHGVEPNKEMREAGDRLLGGKAGFFSHRGKAEDTGLADHSADLITAAQAFHWFDRPLARQEFARVLKPGGWVALIWNERRVTTTPFLRSYEALLETFATDYQQVNHMNIDAAAIADFFAPSEVYTACFNNAQAFDFKGLEGRLMSCSYAPPKGHPQHEPMIAALHELFDSNAEDGVVRFEYDCRVWRGRLSPV